MKMTNKELTLQEITRLVDQATGVTIFGCDGTYTWIGSIVNPVHLRITSRTEFTQGYSSSQEISLNVKRIDLGKPIYLASYRAIKHSNFKGDKYDPNRELFDSLESIDKKLAQREDGQGEIKSDLEDSCIKEPIRQIRNYFKGEK